MLNAFTVDVEDYFQVSAFERQIDRQDWDRYESRVLRNTRRILQLLKAYRVHATFFVLGWVAERFPDLVRRIQDEGHEIGSHGYWHRLIYQQTPDEFRADLCRARDLLQGITGERVVAYRAPSFSITARSRWALALLAEEGFTIDSSIFPIHHDRYGIPDAQPYLHQIETAAGSLWEFPPSVMRVACLNLPVSGGGYFRLYPGAWTRSCLRRINRSAHEPFMFYIHPWEIDPQQPRLRVGSWLARRRHYLNLAHTEGKLAALLDEFRFAPLGEVIQRSPGTPRLCGGAVVGLS